MVRDGDPAHTVDGRDGDLDRSLLRGVHQRVSHQVAEYLAKAGVVALDDDGAVRGQGDLALRSHSTGVRGGITGDRVEVDRLSLERPALVKPGDQQHVVDEHRHAHRLLLDSPAREVRVSGRFSRTAAKHLRVAANRCQGRAQLMRRVGDKAPQPRVGLCALRHRRLDLAQHSVQRQSQPADLRLGRGGLHAPA